MQAASHDHLLADTTKGLLLRILHAHAPAATKSLADMLDVSLELTPLELHQAKSPEHAKGALNKL